MDKKELTIDARGLSCPQPVLLTQQALAQQPTLCRVLVDNATAEGNVSRFAQHAGYQVSIAEAEGEFTLTLRK